MRRFVWARPADVHQSPESGLDNSAKDLEAVLEQYVFMFTSNLGFPITDSNIS
jgi:hypothetical protein